MLKKNQFLMSSSVNILLIESFGNKSGQSFWKPLRGYDFPVTSGIESLLESLNSFKTESCISIINLAEKSLYFLECNKSAITNFYGKNKEILINKVYYKKERVISNLFYTILMYVSP